MLPAPTKPIRVLRGSAQPFGGSMRTVPMSAGIVISIVSISSEVRLSL
jgi:hypothetical protein